jgi:predicted nucleic acid-binding Zn ribbon protein
MPWYDYRCLCGRDREVCKSARDLQSTIEVCDCCGHAMELIFSRTNIIVRNSGLSHDFKVKYNDRTGSRAIEVGNEDLDRHIKIPDKNIVYEKACKEAISEL